MAVRTIPVDAHEALHEYTNQLQPPLNVVMMLMSEAGMRVGEVTRLLWSDILIQNKVVTALYIPSNVAKGGHARTIGVNHRLSAAITLTWLKWCNYKMITTLDFVSATQRGNKPMSTRTIQRATHKLGQRLGVANLNPHMLRHTFATRLMRVTDMRTVQEALGHRRLNTTQVYTHPTIDNITTAVEKI